MLLPGLVDLVGGWQRWPKAVSSHQKFQNLCCQIPIDMMPEMSSFEINQPMIFKEIVKLVKFVMLRVRVHCSIFLLGGHIV